MGDGEDQVVEAADVHPYFDALLLIQEEGPVRAIALDGLEAGGELRACRRPVTDRFFALNRRGAKRARARRIPAFRSNYRLTVYDPDFALPVNAGRRRPIGRSIAHRPGTTGFLEPAAFHRTDIRGQLKLFFDGCIGLLSLVRFHSDGGE